MIGFHFLVPHFTPYVWPVGLATRPGIGVDSPAVAAHTNDCKKWRADQSECSLHCCRQETARAPRSLQSVSHSGPEICGLRHHYPIDSILTTEGSLPENLHEQSLKTKTL